MIINVTHQRFSSHILGVLSHRSVKSLITNTTTHVTTMISFYAYVDRVGICTASYCPSHCWLQLPYSAPYHTPLSHPRLSACTRSHYQVCWQSWGHPNRKRNMVHVYMYTDYINTLGFDFFCFIYYVCNYILDKYETISSYRCSLA